MTVSVWTQIRKTTAECVVEPLLTEPEEDGHNHPDNSTNHGEIRPRNVASTDDQRKRGVSVTLT